MYTRLLVLFVAAVTMISCQFSETMVLNEDGTGRMTIGMDVSEMMAFSGEFAKDSTMVKTDTTVAFRDILIENPGFIDIFANSSKPSNSCSFQKCLSTFTNKTHTSGCLEVVYGN